MSLKFWIWLLTCQLAAATFRVNITFNSDKNIRAAVKPSALSGYSIIRNLIPNKIASINLATNKQRSITDYQLIFTKDGQKVDQNIHIADIDEGFNQTYSALGAEIIVNVKIIRIQSPEMESNTKHEDANTDNQEDRIKIEKINTKKLPPKSLLILALISFLLVIALPFFAAVFYLATAIFGLFKRVKVFSINIFTASKAVEKQPLV